MARRFVLNALSHGTRLLDWPEPRLEQVRELIAVESELIELTGPFIPGKASMAGDEEEEAPAAAQFSYDEVGMACDALVEIIRTEYPDLDEIADSLDEVIEDLEGLPSDEVFEAQLED